MTIEMAKKLKRERKKDQLFRLKAIMFWIFGFVCIDVFFKNGGSDEYYEGMLTGALRVFVGFWTMHFGGMLLDWLAWKWDLRQCKKSEAANS